MPETVPIELDYLAAWMVGTAIANALAAGLWLGLVIRQTMRDENAIPEP